MTPHPATTVLAKALFLLAIAAAAGCDRDGAQMPIGQKTHELKLTGMQEPCPAGLSENGRPVSQAVLDRVRQVRVTWPEGVAIDRERRDGVFYHDAIVFNDPTSDGPSKTLTGCSASIDELAAWACVRNPVNEGLPCAPERLDRPPHPEAPVMPSKPEDLKDPAGRACEQLPASLSGLMLVRCVFGPEAMAVAREKAREQGKAQDRAGDGAARQTSADASTVGDENGLPARRPTVQPPFGRVAPDDRIRILHQRREPRTQHRTPCQTQQALRQQHRTLRRQPGTPHHPHRRFHRRPMARPLLRRRPQTVMPCPRGARAPRMPVPISMACSSSATTRKWRPWSAPSK